MASKYASDLLLRRAARIILIGAPGVGKGTHTERLLQRYQQLSSISSGDLLRQNVRDQTPVGKQAAALMNRGEMVPDNMILRLIRNALMNKGWLIPQEETTSASQSGTRAGRSQSHDNDPLPTNTEPSIDGDYDYSEHPDASFILDGFPRTAHQANQLDNLIPINFAIHVHTPFEVILDRITNRWIHPPSGRTYNTTFNPPKVDGKDDETGEQLVQRDDDKPEVWKARLKYFEESAQPLLEHYDKMGVYWKVQGNTSNEISPKIFEEFQKRFGMKEEQ